VTPSNDVPAAARWIVRVTSWLVPRRARADWLEEWQSELWHEAAATHPGARALTRAAFGALSDALAAREVETLKRRSKRRRESTFGGIAMINETRIALRGFARSPGFMLMAVLTLALGIGANAALFTVIDSVLLRPLPYPDAERLVVIRHPVPYAGPDARWEMSPHGFMLFQDRNDVFDAMGAYVPNSYNMSLDGTPDRARGAQVSASIFATLGARPAAGRLLTDSDNAPGAASVVVLGHDFWQRRFAGDPAIIGSVVSLNGNPYEVVGVTEAGLGLPRQTMDVWTPLTLDRSSTPQNSHFYNTIARLRPGVTIEAAAAEAKRLAAVFPEELPNAYSVAWLEESGFDTELKSLHKDVVGGASTALWVVFGAVGVVLLIACANVANLFFVRAETRRREVAVRSALGASRASLLRQFLAESTVLAAFAGIVGLFVGWAGVRLLIATAPDNIPRLDQVQMRGATVLFTAVIVVVSGVVFGLFPLLHLRRRFGAEALIDGTGRTTAGRSRLQVRGALVVAQVALALTLLTGAGLLMRSALHLRAVEPGFQPSGLMTFDLTLPFVNYRDHISVHRFHDRLLGEVRALPGVVEAGAVTSLPLGSGTTCFTLSPAEHARPTTDLHVHDAAPGNVSPCIDVAIVTPGWFEAMQIPVRGRTFTAQDNESPVGAIVITHALAERFWPGQEAIGRQIAYGPVLNEVVGVTSDIRQQGLDQPVAVQAFLPIVPPEPRHQWFAARSMTVVVRTTRNDPATVLPDVRQVLAQVDAEIPIANPRTMEQVVVDSMARVTFLFLMLAIAAAVAVALGTVGLYSVIAYVVAQRSAEIGIRIALGARPAEIGAMVVRQSLVLTGMGVAIGVFASLAGSRVLQSLLFAVSATDPLTIVGVSALLLLVAAVAAWAPARRAARIDPIESMRA
jgi:putative ABC transport system permease protein